jgi:putative Holliday junction resolvase
MPESILAFDFGLRRIGVAVGQQITHSANPLGVVRNGEGGPDWMRIRELIQEWRPDRIIVGMPLHADGTKSEVSKTVDAFIADLARYDVPVESVDERYSSVEAEEMLRNARAEGRLGKISKEMIDAAAAVLIAERFLSGH